MEPHITISQIHLSNGETIVYRERAGGEQPVILLHGNMSSSLHWEPLFQSLPLKYKLYAPDLRGFGKSTYVNHINCLKDFADDIFEWSAKLCIGEAIYIGWSTGGGVAMEVEIAHPTLIKKLILLSSVGVSGYPLKKTSDGTEYLKTREEIANDAKKVQPVLKAYAENKSSFIKALWNSLIYDKKQPEESKYSKYLDEILCQRNYVDIVYSLSIFNIGNTFNGVAEGNGKAKEINCPVLIIWGEDDRVVSKEQTMGIKDAIPHADITILSKCGHSIMTDNLVLLTDTIASYLEK